MSKVRKSWADICEQELNALFDDAEAGIDLFVLYELVPLSKNVLRAVNLRTLLHDLGSLRDYGVVRFRGEDGRLLLESEFQISRAFSRYCIGPVGLNIFLNQTFGLLQDALGRRHGEDRARELVEGALEELEPVRGAALHMLATGPSLVRALSGPGAYLVAPALWIGTSAVAGGGRRERERAGCVYARILERLTGAVHSRYDERAPMRVAAAGLLSVATAAVAASVGYSVMDTGDRYRQLLIDVEQLLLTGSADEESEGIGPGLLELVAKLDEAGP